MADEKTVDEKWKEQMRKQAEEGSDEGAPAQMEAEPSFLALVSSLAMQAVVCLGQQPDPLTGRTIQDLAQAQYVIDLLGILAEKTKGNLTEDEGRILEGTLHELRMLFVDSTMPQGEKKPEPEKPGDSNIIVP